MPGTQTWLRIERPHVRHHVGHAPTTQPLPPDRSHKRVARAVGSIGLALRLTFAPFAPLRFNKPVPPEASAMFSQETIRGRTETQEDAGPGAETTNEL